MKEFFKMFAGAIVGLLLGLLVSFVFMFMMGAILEAIGHDVFVSYEGWLFTWTGMAYSTILLYGPALVGIFLGSKFKMKRI